MNTWAILLAAGRGLRLASHASGLPKQFLPYQGAPLFWRSALTLSRLPKLRGIVFVFPPLPDGTFSGPGETVSGPAAFAPPASALALEPGLPGPNASDSVFSNPAQDRSHDSPLSGPALLARLGPERLGLYVRTVTGGERRQDSVASALAVLPPDCDTVLVHDSARPFASAALMQRVMDALAEGRQAVIPGVAVADTIKSVDADDLVSRTHARERLRAVQTPQGFALPALREAHARAVSEGWEVTDDAALMERCGVPVLVVPGEEGNRKITTPEDLRLLDGADQAGVGAAMASPALPAMIPCAGFGYDVHRYGGGRPFILGGVPIRCDMTVAAHSDGDTLLHALIDALLGCIGGGDIGALFPDSDPALDNISSGILLAEVLERTRLAGLTLTGVDVTVIAQVPRLAPHRQAIAANLAKLLDLPLARVNVKATTEEGLGFTGEKRGIKVAALVSGLIPSARADLCGSGQR